MASGKDVLFAGATRPSLVWGVTYEAIIFCIATTGVIFLAANSIWLLPLYVPLHGACYLICLKDPVFSGSYLYGLQLSAVPLGGVIGVRLRPHHSLALAKEGKCQNE